MDIGEVSAWAMKAPIVAGGTAITTIRTDTDPVTFCATCGRARQAGIGVLPRLRGNSGTTECIEHLLSRN
jgi:hypothetical protein